MRPKRTFGRTVGNFSVAGEVSGVDVADVDDLG
jgi:hypothetical protein